MPEGGFFEQKRASPTSLAIVVLLHGAAIAALALSKMDVVVIGPKDPIDVFFVKPKQDPPPLPPPPDQKEVRQDSVIDQPRPILDRPIENDQPLDWQPMPTPPIDRGPIGQDPVKPEPQPLPLPPPPAEPVRVEAQIDSRSALQPPYPPSEQRAEREGTVTVRVRIGADGRVKSVEKLQATSDAFFRATEQQALRHWRFRPATLDGAPVESTKTMTVRFRLDD